MKLRIGVVQIMIVFIIVVMAFVFYGAVKGKGFEDFLTYDIVDNTDGYLTIESNKISFDHVIDNTVTYVIREAESIGDFTHDFEFKISEIDYLAATGIWGLSKSDNTKSLRHAYSYDNGGGCLYAYVYRFENEQEEQVVQFRVREFNDNPQGAQLIAFNIEENTPYYARIIRQGDLLIVQLFTSPSRGMDSYYDAEMKQVSTRTYEYILPFTSRGQDATESTTGYVANLRI